MSAKYLIMLSTSNARKDVTNCYDPGANSFITKPNSYGELVRISTAFAIIGCKLQRSRNRSNRGDHHEEEHS